MNKNNGTEEFYKRNLKVYINGVKNKSYYYFTPKKCGVYTIIIKFSEKFTSCASIFNLNYNRQENLIKSIDLSYFNSKNVISMQKMFNGCKNLIKIKFPSSFDTNNVTDMSGMFQMCENLKEIDLSCFNTKNVKNMSVMFQGCTNISKIILSSFNTQNVENMNEMFEGCENLENIDLSSFNYEKTKSLNKDSEKIKEIIDETFIEPPIITY